MRRWLTQRLSNADAPFIIQYIFLGAIILACNRIALAQLFCGDFVLFFHFHFGTYNLEITLRARVAELACNYNWDPLLVSLFCPLSARIVGILRPPNGGVCHADLIWIQAVLCRLFGTAGKMETR